MNTDITILLRWIIPVLIIVILMVIIWKLIRRIGRGVTNIVSMSGITSEISDAVNNQASQTPRQLQNLTNTYTAIIRRDFPEFDPKEFLTSAENTLISVLNSIENKAIENKSNLSPNLVRKLVETINDIKSKGEDWFFDDIYIHKSCIAKYSSLAGSKMIKVEIAVQYSHGVMKDGIMISGSRSVGQYKYSIDAVYVQDVDKMGNGTMLGHKCPNCSAPVNQIGEGKYCPYCGTGLTEVNTRIWVFDNYNRC